MKIISVKELAIPDVKVVRFQRFADKRGYFTEHYRKSDFNEHEEMSFLKGVDFVQANESFSRKGTIRGLHFQWNPFMGKLVRTLTGRMVDMFLDIRKGSPTYGKAAMYEMPANYDAHYSEWIWVPVGFAHGNFFSEDSSIEYFCSGQYSSGCEGCVSPIAEDIDWSLCDAGLLSEFKGIAKETELMTDKDRDGFSFQGWKEQESSDNFIYGKC